MPPELGQSHSGFSGPPRTIPHFQVDATTSQRCQVPGVLDYHPLNESMLELHRCRLIEWSPSPVVALAPSVDGTAIAAARESGHVEIWRTAAGSVGWTCEVVSSLPCWWKLQGGCFTARQMDYCSEHAVLKQSMLYFITVK